MVEFTTLHSVFALLYLKQNFVFSGPVQEPIQQDLL
jgi:hypothetical protein